MMLYLQLSMGESSINLVPCKVERVESINNAVFQDFLKNPSLGKQWALEGAPRKRQSPFDEVYCGVMVLNMTHDQGVFIYDCGERFAYLPAAKTMIAEAAAQNGRSERPFKGVRFHQTLKISLDMLAIINGYLTADSPEKYQGEENTIVHTVRFPDGKEMDIKCCGWQDEASWTEAVLFNSQGYQMTFSEVCGEYLGRWELDCGDIIYSVDVVAEGEISVPARRP